VSMPKPRYLPEEDLRFNVSTRQWTKLDPIRNDESQSSLVAESFDTWSDVAAYRVENSSDPWPDLPDDSSEVNMEWEYYVARGVRSSALDVEQRGGR
jgi:hypothetical protein